MGAKDLMSMFADTADGAEFQCGAVLARNLREILGPPSLEAASTHSSVGASITTGRTLIGVSTSVKADSNRPRVDLYFDVEAREPNPCSGHTYERFPPICRLERTGQSPVGS